MVHSRLAALGLLGTAVLLIAACDASPPPWEVVNLTANEVSISFFSTPSGRLIKAGFNGADRVAEATTIQPRGIVTVAFFEPRLDRYTIRVRNSEGLELFKRDYLSEELDDLRWRTLITPEGIQ